MAPSFLDTIDPLVWVWRASGWSVACWWLVLGWLVMVLGRNAPRSALWVGVVGLSSVAMVGAGAAMESPWWWLALFASALMLWVVLSPLILWSGWVGEVVLICVGSALWMGDLLRGLSGWVVDALGLEAGRLGLIELLGLVIAIFAIGQLRLPLQPWFRVLTVAGVGSLTMLRGVVALWGSRSPTPAQAPLLYLSALAGGLFVIWLLQQLGSQEQPVKRAFSYRGEPSDGWLEGYRPWAGMGATHAFLILFTIATIYPVLWVVKMAVTPTQGFSMGLNPIPRPVALWWQASREGKAEVAACYRRALLQNFGEVTGLGSACLDQVCEAVRHRSERGLAVEEKVVSYRALCTPFVQAWSLPKDQRPAALAGWQGAVLAKVSSTPERAEMQKVLVRIKEQHDERIKRRSLFWRQLLNSVLIALVTTILGVFLACTAAYAFSRFRFPGRSAGLMSFLVSQMFPGTLMMIPLYILMSRLGLLNSLLGLTLVYSTTSIPFCVWMLKGYFDTIPKEIEEAALMDGASRTVIFLRIILPLARPAIAVTALFSFMTAWNEFILAATFMNDEKHYTLPVMLQSFVGSYNTEWGHFAAGAILVSVPIVLLFFALQKNLVGGLTAGSVKG